MSEPSPTPAELKYGLEKFHRLLDEPSGYVVVVIFKSRKSTQRRKHFPKVYGPFPTKNRANRASVRLRKALKKVLDEQTDPFRPPPLIDTVSVQPMWKPIEGV